MPAAAAALAVLAVLTAAHVAFWRWKLHAPTREDEVLAATTGDGWTLHLGRRRPRGARRLPPVLLVHGIAMNRQAFDFGVERWSLAAFLSRAGFDCFTLDLRGHGRSRHGPSRRWNLDTHLNEDLPAAFDAIRAATGAARVLYVGHSQGAILGMAACVLHPSRVAALVALGGPTHFAHQPRLATLVKLRHLGAGRVLRELARAVAPFSGAWHPSLFELAINVRNMDRAVYRRLLANALEDLQPGVLDQWAAFVREDSFRSFDGAIDYRARLAGCRQPALFVSGPRDGIAPPPVVEASCAAWGGPKAVWSAGGDFGHTDLLLGRDAPDVVFPAVRDFLVVHSALADATAGEARTPSR